MTHFLGHRAARVAGALAGLVAAGCGSTNGAIESDGSAGNIGSQEARDGSLTREAEASPGTPEDDGAIADAVSPPLPADATSSVGDAEAGDAASGIQGAGTFHGVNWADARDNFVNGLLQVSGLDTTSDTYATVQAKAAQILAQFRTKLGANAIRIPINEPTVSGTWWSAYKAVIDAATTGGMKVMVAYWA